MKTFNLLFTAFLALPCFWGAAPALGQAFLRDTGFSFNIDFNQPGGGRSINGMIEHADGRLVVYGNFVTSHNQRNAARFFANGQPDLGFMAAIHTSNAQRMVAKPYGYFVVVSGGAYYKIGHDGAEIDYAFRAAISSDKTGSYYGAPFHLPDGKYLVGCSQCGYPVSNPDRWLGLVRILPSGHVDTTFAHNIYPGEASPPIAFGPDKLLLGGGFPFYDGIPVSGMCRIDLEGNLDPTFQSIFTSGVPHPRHVQPDGKILVTGRFTIPGSSQELHFVRLNPDGSLDHTFNNFDNSQPHGNAICPTSDGGYLFGGSFTHYQGQARGGIVKTDADGFIEPGYFTGTGFDSAPFPNLGIGPSVSAIVRGQNDRYYVMGYFNGYNGQAVQPIIRLNGPQTVASPEEVQETASVAVYPNPAREQVQVQLNGSATEGTLQLYSVTGRQVLQQQVIGSATVSLQGLPQGLYLYSMQAGGQVLRGKLVVE